MNSDNQLENQPAEELISKEKLQLTVFGELQNVDLSTGKAYISGYLQGITDVIFEIPKHRFIRLCFYLIRQGENQGGQFSKVEKYTERPKNQRWKGMRTFLIEEFDFESPIKNTKNDPELTEWSYSNQ